MSLFFTQQRALSFPNAEELVRSRTSGRTITGTVTAAKALRHSAVWACRRLRADLVSTMPVDVFRRVDGVQVDVTPPPFFSAPSGSSLNIDWHEWAYSSQADLDTFGNAVGVITARGADRTPQAVELAPFEDVKVIGKGARVTEWKINGESYSPDDIWHEKQYTVSGMPLGLSPIAHAAISVGGYLSAQEFAQDWFTGGAIPNARLKNTAKVLTPEQARIIKDRFHETVRHGDVFVHGADWEYEPIAAKASESSFIDAMEFGVTDICRFMGVPADMIDAASGGSSITYANITQRNLQLLIMNLGPALVRRETAFTNRLVVDPRYVKFNRGALLAMDLKTRYEAHRVAIDSRILTPDEARELEDRPPLTEDQKDEFARLFITAPKANGEGPDVAELAATIQKLYLGVGKVLTEDEARELLNQAGMNLPIPGPGFAAE